jgi:hypothetical protein
MQPGRKGKAASGVSGQTRTHVAANPSLRYIRETEPGIGAITGVGEEEVYHNLAILLRSEGQRLAGAQEQTH